MGRLGPQPQLIASLPRADRKQLRASIDRALAEAGIVDPDKRGRGLDRIIGTTLDPVANHVARYLDLVAIRDVPVNEIAAWWRIRSKIAHGSAVDVNASDLMRLINCFQTSLRREAGIEPLPNAHPA